MDVYAVRRRFFKDVSRLPLGEKRAREVALPHAAVALLNLALPEIPSAVRSCDRTFRHVPHAEIRMEALRAGERRIARVRSAEGRRERVARKRIFQFGVELVRPEAARLGRIVQLERHAVGRARLDLPREVAREAVDAAPLGSLEHEPRPAERNAAMDLSFLP